MRLLSTPSVWKVKCHWLGKFSFATEAQIVLRNLRTAPRTENGPWGWQEIFQLTCSAKLQYVLSGVEVTLS